MIWESVKSVCQPAQALVDNPQVEFLTANTKDFAGSDNQLHPDLVLELKDAGLFEGSVVLIADVEGFFKNRIDAELEELEEIKKALLKDRKFNRFNVEEESARVLSQDYIDEVLNDADFDSGQRYYLPGYVEDPTISSVNDPVIDDITVRRLGDQSVLIEVYVSVFVDIDFFIENGNYYSLEENKQPFILDRNWNDSYMWCENTAVVSALLTFRTTPKLGKILSVDVQMNAVEM